MMTKREWWKRYQEYLISVPELGLSVDVSRMNFPDDYLDHMESRMQQAFKEMQALESGEVANPDEKRMVGHYWLRAPDLAPSREISRQIILTLRAIKEFSNQVHTGRLSTPHRQKFSRLLIIGIGGSILGPQFVSQALRTTRDPMKTHFFDNTDPDGMDFVLKEIGKDLPRTLTIVISKSGRTKETRNGMLEAKASYERRRLNFEKYAVAITQRGSALDLLARRNKWLAVFPMWDWIGGRTSELSAVGLLPAALQGIDIDGLLTGARLCDEVTRRNESRMNPAALIALMWYYATGGRGNRDMVILPYKDRLQLFPRYLQQLVMESLGKEKDLDGKTVHQGITVYGNKGSTDQHALVQQLQDGVNNFFVTFVEVLKDRKGTSIEVEPGVTSGDYLFHFLQGTRQSLSEKGRESMTITVEEVNARSVGCLIALFERAVGFYGSLIRVNAYNQPGVEAGKKAAQAMIELQARVLNFLRKEKGKSFTPEEVASALQVPDEAESIFKLLEHAAANPDHGIRKQPGTPPFTSHYEYERPPRRLITRSS